LRFVHLERIVLVCRVSLPLFSRSLSHSLLTDSFSVVRVEGATARRLDVGSACGAPVCRCRRRRPALTGGRRRATLEDGCFYGDSSSSSGGG